MNFMCVDVPAGMNMNITAVWFFKVSWKILNIFTSATHFFQHLFFNCLCNIYHEPFEQTLSSQHHSFEMF